jgi:5-deoxy-D-glucuronate isomerase
MAGPKRTWKFHNDPEHEWLLKRKSVYERSGYRFA